MKLNSFEKLIGSGLYTGFIPFASGTFGSLAAVVLYLIPGFENPTFMGIIILITILYGIGISSKFEVVYGEDPSQCTIDEFAGTWISLLFIPKQWITVLGAFVIWRILDIVKPFPADKAENLKGGLGIMLDDVIAGFYTFIIMHFIIYLTTNFS